MKPRFITLTRDHDGSEIDVNPATICWMRSSIENFYHQDYTWVATAERDEAELFRNTKSEIYRAIDKAYAS